jgi:hypothetical protein
MRPAETPPMRTPSSVRAYPTYQYNPSPQTYTFWDDHKHMIWTLTIAAIFAGAIVALFQSASLCGCAPTHPKNEILESAEA